MKIDETWSIEVLRVVAFRAGGCSSLPGEAGKQGVGDCSSLPGEAGK